VYPDSIVMIKDPVTKEVGFVFPSKAAIEYRNLLANRVPEYEKTIAIQESKLSTCDSLVTDKKKEIAVLEGILKDERLKNSKLDTLNKECEKQLKCKKFWQTASYVLFGTTVVLSGIVIAK